MIKDKVYNYLKLLILLPLDNADTNKIANL